MIKKFSLILIFFCVFLFSLLNKISAKDPSLTEVKSYRMGVLDLINDERISKGLSKLEVDEQLCKLAYLLAEDSEKNYPKKIDSDVFFYPKYKGYVKNYSSVDSLSSSAQDDFVDFVRRNPSLGELSEPDNETLYKTFSGSFFEKTISNNKITTGCIASSSGKVGYKSFSFFVVGTKKGLMDTFPFNIIKFIRYKIGLNKQN